MDKANVVCVCIYIYEMKYYSAMKRRKFVTTWMGREDIMLSNITQRKTNTG